MPQSRKTSKVLYKNPRMTKTCEHEEMWWKRKVLILILRDVIVEEVLRSGRTGWSRRKRRGPERLGMNYFGSEEGAKGFLSQSKVDIGAVDTIPSFPFS
jgi:hypothetical protein